MCRCVGVCVCACMNASRARPRENGACVNECEYLETTNGGDGVNIPGNIARPRESVK